MLKYLVVLLDETSVSFCYCDNSNTEAKPISLDALKSAIQFGMEENLSVHFVFPDYKMPDSYMEVINAIDSERIVSSGSENDGTIVVFDNWEQLLDSDLQNICILRTDKKGLFSKCEKLIEKLPLLSRLNIVITDIDTFTDEDFINYRKVLEALQTYVVDSYREPIQQINCITDRLMLSTPNHCNAGVESITIAPNGKFYICPAFYYSDKKDSAGDISKGLTIKNPQLLRLDCAPLCRTCDAFQCRRCVWMNRKTTGELNVPSHEQCVVSHIERNTSRVLLSELKTRGYCHDFDDINELYYLDPFEQIKSN